MLEVIAAREVWRCAGRRQRTCIDQLGKGHEYLITSKGKKRRHSRSKAFACTDLCGQPIWASPIHEHDPSIEEGRTDETNMSRLKKSV